MATLRVKTGPNRGKVFEIKDQVLTLGRDESQTIQILDQGVSRSHAEIFRLGESCFVRDLDSTNGTFVNNLKVAEETLKNGDELLIGTTILVFEDGPPTEARPEGADYKSGTTTISLKAASKAGKPVTREVDSRNLAGMTEIGKILGASQDLKSSLQRVVETLAALIKAEQGYLYMMDAAVGKLTAMASVEHGEPRGEKKVSRTIVNRVLKSGTPTLTPDATLDDRFTLSESIVLKKVKSVIAVPVTIRGQAQGLFYFHGGGAPEPFDEYDLELVSAAALQVVLAIASRATGERLRRAMLTTVRALVAAMEAADPKSRGHAERIADYSTAIALRMGMSRDDAYNVRLSALLCDVGNLTARGEQHVSAAEKIVAGIEGAEEILAGVRYHHERADGSGYPYRIKNDQTPVMARIIIVASHFESLCASGGAGGEGMPVKQALEEIGRKGGTEFDDQAVKALLECQRDGTIYAGASLLQD